jgi:hypothetical protein
MGREARCRARWPGGEGEVKALLETHELIIRGERSARWPLEDLADVVADGGSLRFATPDGPVSLELGPAALSWARKMTTPPPTLAEKLGLGPERRVQVVGEIDEPVLEVALAPALALAGEAKVSLGVVASLADLDRLLEAHAALPADAPVWVLNVKGPKSPFGENAVRAEMRARGFMDNKTASVSTQLTGTRYARRKA